jgi:hypothetical protein
VFCDTDLPSFCQLGIRDCREGVLGECRQVLPATDELCDAADNDCDGLIDEDGVCPVSELARGVFTFGIFTPSPVTVGPRHCGEGKAFYGCTATRTLGVGSCQVLARPTDGDGNPLDRDRCECTIVTSPDFIFGGDCAWSVLTQDVP